MVEDLYTAEQQSVHEWQQNCQLCYCSTSLISWHRVMLLVDHCLTATAYPTSVRARLPQLPNSVALWQQNPGPNTTFSKILSCSAPVELYWSLSNPIISQLRPAVFSQPVCDVEQRWSVRDWKNYFTCSTPNQPADVWTLGDETHRRLCCATCSATVRQRVALYLRTQLNCWVKTGANLEVMLSSSGRKARLRHWAL